LSVAEHVALEYARCGYNFAPLVTERQSPICKIHFLILRADLPGPGHVIESGDIDNRVKSLFDALRMVRRTEELGSYVTPGPGENPFYCLLEDDSLVTHLSVETDRMLEPIKGTSLDANDARVVITVTIEAYDYTVLLRH
jgi:hypothetical protein